MAMPRKSHDWTRYWISNRDAVTLDDAYLADPEAFPGVQASTLRTTASLCDLPAAALFAEPGLGKSTELAGLEDACLTRGRQVISHNLASFSDFQDVSARLFNAPELTAWKRAGPDQQLTLLLDGLDELTAVSPTAGTALAEAFGQLLGQAEFTDAEFEALCGAHTGLKNVFTGLVTAEGGRVLLDWNKLRSFPRRLEQIPVEALATVSAALRARRLQLFISCRTAEWPARLGETLSALWGDAWTELELTPLRREDVRIAVQDEELDPDHFLGEVDRSGAHAMAARPITLKFLIDAVRSGTDTPLTQMDLYEEGCRRLCEEVNEQRLDADLTGSLSAAQCLAVAKRVAALSLFGQRTALITRPAGPSNPADLLSSDVVGGEEGQNGSLVAVTEQAIKEVAKTALFTSRGPGRQGWAHRTYLEYLAARYLIDTDLTDQQLLSLITQPGDPQQRVAAAWRDVASWLSVMRPALGQLLARRDPLSLMSTAALPVDDESKRMILEAYLEREAADTIPYQQASSRQYDRFRHPGIAEQLRPWLSDPSRPDRVRVLALRIAEFTRAEALWPELTQLALNVTTPVRVREAAAAAAAALLPEAERHQLRPLLDEPTTDDLRGWALKALWPDQLSTQDLLASLKEPARRGYSGAYQRFLSEENLWAAVPDQEILQVIAWLADPAGGAWMLPVTPYAEIEGRQFRRRLLLRLWEALAAPDNLQPFTALFASRFTSHAGLAIMDGETDRLQTDVVRRQQVIQALSHLLTTGSDALWLVSSTHPLVQPEDASWVLDRYEAAEAQERPFWQTLITYSFRTEQMEAALTGRVCSRDLQSLINALTPDPAAPKPAWLVMHEQMAAQAQAERDARPKFDQEIEEALSEMQAGNAEAWWIIPHRLHVNEDRVAIGGAMQLDMRQLNGWSLLDEALQTQIVSGAKDFVRLSTLIADQQSPEYSSSGVRALRLLKEVEPDFVDGLSSNVWDKWISGLMLHVPLNDTATETDYQLWQQAYQSAPTTFLTCLREEISRHDNPFLATPVIRMLLRVLDPSLETFLLSQLQQSPSPHAEIVADVLQVLLNAHSVKGRAQAGRLVQAHTVDQPTAIAAALVLISHTADAGWAEVWPAIQADSSFGEQVTGHLAQGARHRGPDLATRLSEEHLGALYQWVEQHFPEAADPVRPTGMVYTPTAREDIGTWRDGLLNGLAGRGTEAALKELSRLEPALPQAGVTLRRAYAFAEEQWLQQSCLPVAPSDILALSRSKRAVLVRDAAQLQELVLASLQELQLLLQGENYAAPDLWNIQAGGKARPKEEEALSDYVTRFLQQKLEQRGVVLSREVQIRRKVGQGGGMGEEIDIYISAVTQDPRNKVFKTVSVIVEVKGSWNKDLKTSLEQQLARRYLADNNVRHGIYLVGWPTCPQWDQNDSKWTKTPKWTLEAAKAFFEKQAEAVSSRENVTIQSVVLNTGLR